MTNKTPSLREERILYSVELIDKELSIFSSKYKISKFMSKQDIEDMRSGCILEIIQAIDRFDESKNVKLITFLCPRIRGFFKDFLRKENKIKYISISDLVESMGPKIDKVFSLDNNNINDYLNDLKLDNIDYQTIYLDITKAERTLSEQITDSLIGMPAIRSYIILSYYILDNSIKEISEELGVNYSSGWVHKLKRKSLEMLRDKLKSKGVLI